MIYVQACGNTTDFRPLIEKLHWPKECLPSPSPKETVLITVYFLPFWMFRCTKSPRINTKTMPVSLLQVLVKFQFETMNRAASTGTLLAYPMLNLNLPLNQTVTLTILSFKTFQKGMIFYPVKWWSRFLHLYNWFSKRKRISRKLWPNVGLLSGLCSMAFPSKVCLKLGAF